MSVNQRDAGLRARSWYHECMHPHSTLHDARRKWIAATMRGESPAWSADLGAIVEMSAAIHAEGVSALIDRQLRTADPKRQPPSEFARQVSDAARIDAALTLLREAECRRMLESFGAADLPCLLLKGSALAYWAYAAPHERPCADIDLLLPSRAAAEAAAVKLCAAGLERTARELPGAATTYELTCVRVIGGVRIEVDLHWDVCGAPVFDRRLSVADLFAQSMALPSLAPNARATNAVHTLVHASMHRALQLHLGTGDRLKWLNDFRLLAGRFSSEQWQQLVQLCERYGLAGICQHALQASAALLDTHVPAQVSECLTRARRYEALDADRMRRWSYVQRQNLRALPARQRMAWLRQRLLPNRVYRQQIYGGGRWLSLGRYLRSGLRKLLIRS